MIKRKLNMSSAHIIFLVPANSAKKSIVVKTSHFAPKTT
jgi:hypothetical protein